jgi:hypothetical protein
MKSFKHFNEFVNESKLPFVIEQTIKSSKIEWKEDKSRIDELMKEQGNSITHAYVFTGSSKEIKINYLMKTWLKTPKYGIQLEENEAVIFFQEYAEDEKRYFDQDCEIILGFLPK